MRRSRIHWITLAIMAAASLAATACSAGAASPAAGVTTPVPGECRLDATTPDWATVPATDGRCTVTVLGPAMSFVAPAGWQWGATPDSWAMSMDEDVVYNTFLSVYRYGGAVVPPYCSDPPPEIPTASAEEIVAWLEAVEGLEVTIDERTVGSYPAWRLDLAAIPGVPSCSGDAGKQGLVSLWTKDGAQFDMGPETLGTGERMLAYLVETGDEILVLAATTQEMGDPTPFYDGVDELFASLRID